MTAQLRPIVLIGAARSGTKIMRDSLGIALGTSVVPYDIGYVWRYGNESRADDCLEPADAWPATTRLVRRFLTKYADAHGVVVEKTVGNALRLPFVEQILPEAIFVHLVRDGVDVTESARREWTSPNDLRYLAGKARHFPLRLVPTYGRKFLANALRRRGRGHAATWGPRYPGIDADLRTDGLLVVCARQWASSVRTASAGLAASGATVVQVRFEELSADPEATITRVVTELGHRPDGVRIEAAARMIRPGAGGRGRAALSADERRTLDQEIGHMLKELGYDPAC